VETDQVLSARPIDNISSGWAGPGFAFVGLVLVVSYRHTLAPIPPPPGRKRARGRTLHEADVDRLRLDTTEIAEARFFPVSSWPT
jgi:hypothetical protein